MRGLFQSLSNSFQNSFSLKQDLGIPEPQHAKSAPLQFTRSLLIGLCRLRMLPAVQFDYQPMLEVAKVNDIASNRMLAPELCVEDLSPS